MSEEEEQKTEQSSHSETAVDSGTDVKAEQSAETTARQVPLAALEAERRKRQELEAQNRILQDYALRFKQLEEQQETKKSSEDDLDLVNKRQLKEFRESLSKEEMAQLKREIAEETFKDVHPEAIKQINLHLKEIIDRKPWLAATIEQAPNRYARAFEIVQDYAPAIAVKKNTANEAQRIVENSKKPGSPVTIGKSPNLSQGDYLRSIAGTKEFRDYRQKLLQGK